METYKSGRVAYANKAVLQIYNQDQNVANITLTKHGKASLTTGGAATPLLRSVKNHLVNFNFKKRGRWLSVEEKFSGVKLIMKGTTIKVIVPDHIYGSNVEGICGDNDGDKKNDFQLSDGTVLPYITGRGHARGES